MNKGYSLLVKIYSFEVNGLYIFTDIVIMFLNEYLDRTQEPRSEILTSLLIIANVQFD